MKRFFPVLLISIFFHILAVGFLFLLTRRDARPRLGPLSIELTPDPGSVLKAPDMRPLKRPQAGAASEKTVFHSHPAIPGMEKDALQEEKAEGFRETSLHYDDPSWNAFTEERGKKRLFMSKTFQPSEKDSLMESRFRDFIRDASVYGAPDRAQQDAVEDGIRKRNLGTETTALPSELLRSFADRMRNVPPEARFNFIPSPVEAGALAFLFQKNKASQLDIYASLDTGLVCTAEKLNEALDHLVEQGFIRRRKISPESILTLVSPFGSIPLELSKINRLNPLYIYEPHIEQQHLMHYLQFRLDRLRRTGVPEDSVRIKTEIRRIHTVMHLLVQNPPG